MENRSPRGRKRLEPSSAGMSRRDWLRAAGAAAAATPFLASPFARHAHAQTGAPPLRLICWPLMNGAESGYFYPGGSDASVLSTITSPIKKWGSLVTFIKGVNVSGASNHQAIRSTYSGASVSSYTSPDPTNLKSVDALVAEGIMNSSPTLVKKVHLGVIPADDLQYYHKGQNKFFYDPAAVDYEANPVTAFDRLFGGGGAKPPAAMGADYTADSLDLLDAEMNDLAGKLKGSPSELGKLGLHQAALKGLRPSAMPAMPAPMTMTSGPLASVEKLRPALQDNPKAAYKYEYFSDTFDAQLDIMARVLVSGLSRVVTIQPGSADNDMIVPVGRGYPHHVTSHGNQATFSMVQNYYFMKMARLLESLDVPDPLAPGKTVLDNTLLVMMAETLPVSHSSNGVPTMLVGRLGGKIATGRVISGSFTNKNVMATVLKAFGQDGAQFGSTVVDGVLA
jgi:hypothetical protein